MPSVYTGQTLLPSAWIDGENPLPLLRHFPANRRVKCDDSVPEELRRRFGEVSSFRILPYNMQDRYTRQRKDRPLKLVFLENEVLKAAVAPSQGGRLWSLYDKKRRRECLFVNPLFQPANLAIRNAWFAGGVEWNIGHLGHAVHTCAPVFVARVEGPDGPFLRIYDFERMNQLFWQVDLHLPEGSPALLAHVRVLNPGRRDVPMYWWTNIALPETKDVRAFASADAVIKMKPGRRGPKSNRYGYFRLPKIASETDGDISYPGRSRFSNEFFFQCHDRPVNWEAVSYGDGSGFFEKSTLPLRYRKVFCWGQHAGGKHWQTVLSGPGVSYLEIQAGLAPTQLHGFTLEGGQTLTWTQAFAAVDLDPAETHQPDWRQARDAVQTKLALALPDPDLCEADRACRRQNALPVAEILAGGGGWGALEFERKSQMGESPPSGLSFPADQIGSEQRPWLDLLREGFLPDRPTAAKPSSWLTDPSWARLLERSLEHPSGRHWHALLHLGIMAWENGRIRKARDYWRASIRECPSVWAYFCLAQAFEHARDATQTLDGLAHAWALPERAKHPGLVAYYLKVLHASGRYEEAWDIYSGLPEADKREERIMVLAGRIAFKRADFDFVENLFRCEYATIREGDVVLTDLWFELQALRLAEQKGVELNNALRKEVRKTLRPPTIIDFRQVNA